MPGGFGRKEGSTVRLPSGGRYRLTEGWQGRVIDKEEGSTEESSTDEEARLGEGAERKKARQTRMLGRENCAAEKNPRQRRELA